MVKNNNIKKFQQMENNKTSNMQFILSIIGLSLICSFGFYMVIYNIIDTINAKRLKTEGVCTIVTIIDRSSGGKGGGYLVDIKYLIGDSIIYSYNKVSTLMLYGDQYWARYLPDKPNFTRFLRDDKKNYIPVEDPLKPPPICNCKSTQSD